MDLKYPIGKFFREGEITGLMIEKWIKDIEQLPSLLRLTTNPLNDYQLDTPYRPGGWTVRQVVHHLADSHMNAYIRFKLALTENCPVIKPYEEGEWAKLADYELPLDSSLCLLEALHIRWVVFLKSLSFEQMKKIFRHPESGEISVGENIGLYAWHGNHHLAHISSLCKRMGW